MQLQKTPDADNLHPRLQTIGGGLLNRSRLSGEPSLINISTKTGAHNIPPRN